MTIHNVSQRKHSHSKTLDNSPIPNTIVCVLSKLPISDDSLVVVLEFPLSLQIPTGTTSRFSKEAERCHGREKTGGILQGRKAISTLLKTSIDEKAEKEASLTRGSKSSGGMKVSSVGFFFTVIDVLHMIPSH